MHVIYRIQQLGEVSSRDNFVESTTDSNKIKQLPSTHILQDYRKAVITFSCRFLIQSILTDVNQIDQIRMMKLLHDFELVFEGLKIGSLGLELFNRHFLVVRGLSKQDSE